MANRADLIEVNTTLSGSGTYAGDWLDSAGVLRARLLFQFSGQVGTVTLEQSSDQTNVIATDTWTNDTERSLTARYFRITANGGAASAAFRAVIRTVD